MLKEFRQFLMRGNLVDLAVAVVIGTAFGALVTSFVANLITPIIAAIAGKPDFSNLTFTVNGSVFRYGSFFNALISFVSIAAAVFFFVVKPIDAMTARIKGSEESTLRECPECLTEIPTKARRCPACTAQVAPAVS